ncbi:MAG: hypothetical protein IKD30_00095 [Peptococcaceae bacterium]|nr:hypothetical protein [Peptococcaceae bacterium]
MMKRSFSLLLILTLILSSFSLVASAAGGVDQVMSDFNIMPQSCSADSENLVTRSEFAFTIANILGSGEQAPRETSYVDVPEDDENSGYIYFATVNGFLLPNGDMFCPNDPITLHDFNDAVVKLLAYETIAQSNGGGVDGAMKTVRDLKIYNGVTITTYDSVTVKQYRQLIYNLMTANIAVFNYNYTQEGNVILNKTSETKTILSQFFGISRYYGSITSVNHAKPSVKFLVTKNVTKANPENLTTGMTYDFLSNGKVDLNFYQNIPVEIWTNKDGVIVYIAPQANVEVFYDVIYSVNGKTNPDLALDLSAIPEGIVLASDLEEEYEIDSSIQIRYNGVVPSVPRKPLAGKYAKIVLINNKITFIETWELDEGGIVTEVNNSYVSFIKGEAETRLKRIGEYEDIIVVIDGRSTDRTQIKPGSLIHYYQPTPEQVEKEGAKDMLAIVVSEKTIAGSFDGMSSHNEVVAGKNVTIIDELEIGRNYYPVEKEKIYVSEDGETYEANAFDSVYDTQVLCYVDIYGDIRYVKALGELNEKNEFTGYIVSAAQSGFDDIQIKVQKIYPDIEEVVITKPSDLAASKYVAHDSATVTTLTTTFSDVDSIKKAALTLEIFILYS